MCWGLTLMTNFPWEPGCGQKRKSPRKKLHDDTQTVEQTVRRADCFRHVRSRSRLRSSQPRDLGQVPRLLCASVPASGQWGNHATWLTGVPRGLTSLSGKVLKGVLIPRGRRWGSAGRATGEEAFSRENRKSGGLGDLGETGNGLVLPTELETSHRYPPYEMVSRQLLSSGTPAAEKSPLLRLWTEAAAEAWTVW